MDNIVYLKDRISEQDIISILTELDADPIMKDGIIISRTICHCGNSHKLYYYGNTRLFRCYTECNDSFDIFELIQKVKIAQGEDYNLPLAILWVSKFCNIPLIENNVFEELNIMPDKELFQRWDSTFLNPQEKVHKDEGFAFKIYDEKILKFLPRPHILHWEQEGISHDVSIARGICFDPQTQAILIPHYDKDNNLIGIRSRTIVEEQEQFGKYIPTKIGKTMYNHPLGLNLYNLNNAKNNILNIHTAIVFESEKSCLKYASYFGIDNDISVAVCGSNFTKFQFNLLKELKVENIVIAYDRQYQEVGDDEWIQWTEKYNILQRKYGNFINISFIVDREHILGYKDSPIDCGPDIFLDLYKKREYAF